ncbi:sel1 repeat family protein, partial [Vibrio sp.]|nr:sel1 repeat family protein [Vibrio sp.]
YRAFTGIQLPLRIKRGFMMTTFIFALVITLLSSLLVLRAVSKKNAITVISSDRQYHQIVRPAPREMDKVEPKTLKELQETIVNEQSLQLSLPYMKKAIELGCEDSMECLISLADEPFVSLAYPNLVAYSENYLKAINGNADARIEVARTLYNADGVTQDIAAAKDHLATLVTQNNTKAMFLLADIKAETAIESGEKAAAFQLFLDSAKLNHIESFTKLGNCYLEGFGTDKNEKLAYYWLERAAESGNDEAINSVVNAYRANTCDLCQELAYFWANVAQMKNCLSKDISLSTLENNISSKTKVMLQKKAEMVVSKTASKKALPANSLIKALDKAFNRQLMNRYLSNEKLAA